MAKRNPFERESIPDQGKKKISFSRKPEEKKNTEKPTTKTNTGKKKPIPEAEYKQKTKRGFHVYLDENVINDLDLLLMSTRVKHDFRKDIPRAMAIEIALKQALENQDKFIKKVLDYFLLKP